MNGVIIPIDRIINFSDSISFTSSTTLAKVHEFVMPESGYLHICCRLIYVNNVPQEVTINLYDNLNIYSVIGRSPAGCIGASVSGIYLNKGDKLYIYAKYGGAGNNRMAIEGSIFMR